MKSRCARPDCIACETERIGCACDGAEDDGCFVCTPDNHIRPPCLPALTDEEFGNKTYTCLRCGKDTGGPTNYCNWGCLEAYNRAHGGKEHLPNGLPVRSIRHDGLMLECEHGDHPDYIGPTPENEYEYRDELHALIYTDGHIALTLYETEPHLWLAGVPYRQRDGREGKFRLADESVAFPGGFGLAQRGERDVRAGELGGLELQAALFPLQPLARFLKHPGHVHVLCRTEPGDGVQGDEGPGLRLGDVAFQLG